MTIMLITVVCFMLPFLSFCEKLTNVFVIPRTSIKYSNCGPDTIHNVDLNPCPTQPCVFDRGINVTVTIDFSTQKAANKVTTKVYGIVAGIPVPYDTPPDACVGCNLKCPLAAATNYTYINTFPILKSYPPIKLPVKWELLDENDDLIVCFLFPMEIK